jgi:hypothetical protein
MSERKRIVSSANRLLNPGYDSESASATDTCFFRDSHKSTSDDECPLGVASGVDDALVDALSASAMSRRGWFLRLLDSFDGISVSIRTKRASYRRVEKRGEGKNAGSASGEAVLA